MDIDQIEADVKSFYKGSWNIYKILDLPEDDDQYFNTETFTKKLIENVKKNYGIRKKFVFNQDNVICGLLEVTKKKKKKKKSDTATEIVRCIKVMVCQDDSLMCCSHKLDGDLKEVFLDTLSCTDVTLLDLCNSHPLEMVKLRRDAVLNPNLNQVQREERLNDRIKEGARLNQNGDSIKSVLGPDSKNYPSIKYARLDVQDTTKKSSAKKTDLKNISITIKTKSIFHYYEHLDKGGYIEELPSWLKDVKQKGRNLLRIKGTVNN